MSTLGAHMSLTVTGFEVDDIRFPTSEQLDGSDAMNPDPDYSAAYVVLRTDGRGRGGARLLLHHRPRQRGAWPRPSRRCAPTWWAARWQLSPATSARCTASSPHDSQLRWLGPEKGVMHMAAGAVVNAAWDLAARRAGQAVWRLLAEMTPEELVALVDFRYLSDALTPRGGAGHPARRRAGPRRARRAAAAPTGYPAYTTSPGWLGYSDEKLVRLAERGRRRRLHPDQAEGRRRPGRRPAAGCGSPARPSARTCGSPWTPTSAGTWPRRCDWMRALGRVRPVLDRGADQPRRRARPRRRPRRRSRSRSPPANTSPTASCSSSCSRPAPSTSSRSTPPGWPGSTRTSRSCCSPPSSASRSARTPAASGCANWCSTCRCSTTWRSPAARRTASSSTSTICTSTSPTRRSSRRALPDPRGPGLLRPDAARSLAAHRYPDGAVWRAREPPAHRRPQRPRRTTDGTDGNR